MEDITLDYTGERMVPEAADQGTFWEHVYRYSFAADHVRGKRVLDIACGEGYGSASLLRLGAQSVIGIDCSAEACAHASRKYGVDARQGDAQNIPLPDASVDVIVSFETIEHLQSPELFIRECERVLVSGGLLIVSTPNADVYRKDESPNPFHVRELKYAEFQSLFDPGFTNVVMFIQRPEVRRSRIRGVGILRRVARELFWRHCDQVDEKYRVDPVAAILLCRSRLGKIANPFALRKLNPSKDVSPLYYVCVATKTVPAAGTAPRASSNP